MLGCFALGALTLAAEGRIPVLTKPQGPPALGVPGPRISMVAGTLPRSRRQRWSFGEGSGMDSAEVALLKV
jgi:hypothetical protein